MVDAFTRAYSSIKDKNAVLKKIHFYSLLRFSIRVIINVFLPAYFHITNLFGKCRLSSADKNDGIIVSLTTFPARIGRVWLIIECMLRQTLPPDRIILWLSAGQFNGLSSLPKSLLRLRARGLEIRFCEGDLRSHKKYYYTVRDFPEATMITIDDDLLYRSALLSDLMQLHRKHPAAICCDRALRILTNGEEILPYLEWEDMVNGGGPAFNIFQTSGGGTLYPPKALPAEVLNQNVFMNYCKYADDVWLNAMSQLNHVAVVKTNANTEWIPIFNLKNTSLTAINVYDGQNDRQLKDVRYYYKKSLNRDIFANLFNT